MNENEEAKLKLFKQAHSSRVCVFKQAWLAYLGVPKDEIDGVPNPEKEGKIKPILLNMVAKKDENGKTYLKVSL